ncbi:MAG: sulfatase-like hydrolase/transferase [Thermoanaerobaculia bacterium]
MFRRLAIAGIALVPLLCGEPAAAAEAPAGGSGPPNVVLVTLDTTRADHLGIAGWPHAATPVLDGLAGRGTRFPRCDSAAPITLPSHATILTGLFPPRHGVRDNGTFTLAAGVETLAERLTAHGYDSAAVVSAIVLARRHGLDQGFRIYDDDLGGDPASGSAREERRADATTDAAIARLAALRPPFFLWVHYYDPHEEYRPPARFADAAGGPTRLYDGEIAFMDAEIGRLLAALPERTVIAAVGDHGEMLGEHGEVSHGLLPLAAARRVPLILAGPGVPAGRSPDCLVRTADLAPTLLALAGVPAGDGLDGTPLLPLDAPGSCERISYSESFLPFYAYKWFPLRTLSDGRALFVDAPQPSLFRLDVDPGEADDLAQREPALLALWSGRISRWKRSWGEEGTAVAPPAAALDEEQMRQLASLGYLGGGGSGEVSVDLPDPRLRVDVARRLHEAADAVREGRCAETLRELQAIVERDPHNFPALSLAGQCLRDAGRDREALALFDRAAAENPASAVPVANRAGCLLRLGRKEEAEREFRHALVLDPTQGDSAANLARLRRESGHPDEALALLDAALAAGGVDPVLYLERGTVRAAGGNLVAALADFREAARRAPEDPVALENAGRAAFHLGRLGDAAASYEALARLAPGRVDVWKTLAALYLELGDAAGVERSAREALRLEQDPGERERLLVLLEHP